MGLEEDGSCPIVGSTRANGREGMFSLPGGTLMDKPSGGGTGTGSGIGDGTR